MAIVRRGERLDLVHIVRLPGKQPEVRRFESFRIELDEADALSRLGEGKRLKGFQTTTLLAESDYRLLVLDAPAVPAEERVQALRWQMKDQVDFAVDTAAVAVAEIPSHGGRQASVIAVAAAATVIGNKMVCFDKAKIDLAAIDIPEMAVRNVAALFEEPNRGLAFLAVCDIESLLLITYQGELCLARHIEMSAEMLTEGEPERRRQMQERLALEVQRTLDNFDRQYGFISVSRLVVASEQNTAELVATLSESIYVPALSMDLASVIDLSAVPELRQPARQVQGLLAMGAALRESA